MHKSGDFEGEILRMERNIKHNWGQETYRYPLRYSLERVIDQWKSDRQESWAKGISEDINDIIDDVEFSLDKRQFKKEEIFEIIEKCADAAIAASNNFDPLEFNAYYYASPGLIRYTIERLEAYFAENLVEKIEEAAKRLMSLEDDLYHVRKIRLTPAVKDFLLLVRRSYLWGFDTESVILCRSAMEKALENRVTYEICEKYFGPPHGGGYSLQDRIIAAKREGILNDETAEIAEKIRLRGNTALHKDPNATKDIYGTIRDTIRVISVITDGFDPYDPVSYLL
jgi:hypothetical protein